MNDDDLLKRYLLGDLPGDEEEALEQRLFVEDGLFELAEALEAEVLEDYSRGMLTPAQNARIARFLRVSPDGRARLAVVRGLAQNAISSPAKAPANVLPFARPARSVPSRRQTFAAIAAMLCVAVGASWLASVRTHGPDSARRAALPESLFPHTDGTPPLPQENQPDPGEQIAANPTPPPVVASPTPSPVVFVATIALSSLRGDEGITSVLVPADTDRVDLRLPLQAGDEDYPSYRVVLTDGLGAEVASRELLPVTRPGKSEPTLVLSVEGKQLPAGRYSLEIQGVLPTGEREDLAFPEFEVREP